MEDTKPVTSEGSSDLAAATARETERADAVNTQTLKVLGEVAQGTPRPVVTATGEVQTPGDRAAELRTREAQGHAYQR